MFLFFASSISCTIPPTLGSFRPVILLEAGTIPSRKTYCRFRLQLSYPSAPYDLR